MQDGAANLGTALAFGQIAFAISVVYVMLKLQNAKTSIKRLQRMLFGHSTEHKRNVLERVAGSAQPGQIEPGPDSGQDPQPPGNAAAAQPPRPRPPGHGRNAAQAYSGAPIVQYTRPASS